MKNNHIEHDGHKVVEKQTEHEILVSPDALYCVGYKVSQVALDRICHGLVHRCEIER